MWTLTPVEIVSALQRLVRTGEVAEREANGAESLLAEITRRSHVIIDVERAKATAFRLLRVHTLRAADAMQLGAALAWADGNADGGILHTFDRQLGLAARREGFQTVPD